VTEKHTRDLVMGASAGGIEALCRALGGEEPLDAAVLVVIHVAPGSALDSPRSSCAQAACPHA
jgi:chemotaxis response regulator CheB